MQSDYQHIRELLARVRTRWRRLVLFQATVRAALAMAGVLALALFLTAMTGRAPMALAFVVVGAAVLAAAALVWGLWPAREAPSDARVARFIEEHDSSLDDRLVSAVSSASGEHGRRRSASEDEPSLVEPLIADAARRASAVDPAIVVPADQLRRAGSRAAAAALLLAAVAFFGRDTARQSVDALSLALFPSRVTLEVTPGNARVRAGSPMTIEARLVGNTAPVVALVLRADVTGDDQEGEWATSEMATHAGAFALALEAVNAPFKYRVAAGSVQSPIYEVGVAHAPRVARIDVEYTYPAALRMAPRTEENGGDIYAPSGTDVRIRVHTNGEAATGRMALANGQTIALTPQPSGNLLSEVLKVAEDGSYRVALADREGLANPGDTEYFIRMLEDRPPEVHVVKPARDRAVTRLEEVEIEAEAEDDYGVDRVELVYAIRGGAEKIVPLRVPRGQTTVNGRHTLYLEDLDVKPGDFVSYYVRARDVARGKRSSVARSDIFFLEVKPFEQEFSLAQSQAAGAGGGSNRSIDDLVAAQKEIIVATWKLDRRAQTAGGAQSAEDVKAVARAEAELKRRVEQASSSFRESAMRDPRRGQAQPGRGGLPPRPAPPAGPEPLRAGQTLPEEDAMTAAATAMARAVTSLDRLKTAEALPPEMEALNHLLRAQADVKRRQVMRQQAGGGGGQNRASQDMSSLFDKELQRHQQTNYETPTSTEQRPSGDDSALDKIKELARRQDELLRRQQDLARRRDQMSPEELKRELEKLTREQSDLRERAEQMAQELGRQSQRQQQTQSGGQQSQGAGQRQAQRSGQSSSQGAGGQAQGAGQQTQGAGQPAPGAAERMREASEAMRNAANELRRQDPGQASASGSRALEELQELQRQMQAEQPDERRRAMGDMQLEARQLADRQRQIAAERARNVADADAMRRLAGEQERLADRVRRLQNGLQQQANAPAAGARGRGASGERAAGEAARTAARDASREIERQRLTERMQQSADQMRNANRPELSASARGSHQASSGGRAEASGEGRQLGHGADTREQQEIARSLDRLADRIAAGVTPGDDESRKLTDQMARAQELRERMETLSRELERLSRQAEQAPGGPGHARGSQQSEAPGGRSGGQGQESGGSGVAEAGRLRDESARRLQQTRELLEQVRRENPAVGRGGGMGFTFEGQGMITSAPGTEAFKQDFAKWEQLRKQATLALEQAESELSRKLQAKDARDRLAAGVDDKPPADYQQHVDSYFKALAEKKTP